MIKIRALILVCIILIIVKSEMACSAERENTNLSFDLKQPLKIAINHNNPPFFMKLPNGDPTGYYVDLLELWSKINNVPIRFVPDSYQDNFEAFKNNEVDLWVGQSINEKIIPLADFSMIIANIPIAAYHATMNESLLDQNKSHKQKIALKENSFLRKKTRKRFPNTEITEMPHVNQMIEALIKGELDQIVGEKPYMNTKIRQFKMQNLLSQVEQPLYSINKYVAIKKGRIGLLNLVDQGLKEVPLQKLVDIEQKWFPENLSYFGTLINKKVPLLNLAQIEWLADHPRLNIGVAKNFLPFEAMKSSRHFVGISSDYMKLLSDKLSLEFIPKSASSWNDILQLTRQGEIDLLPATVVTKGQSKYLFFSETYITFPIVVVTHKNSSIIEGLDDLKGKRVGVEENTPALQLIKTDYPDIVVVPFHSGNEGLKQLEKQNIDAFVHNLAMITYQQNEHGYENIQIAAFTPYDVEVVMGVSQRLQPLVNILNKTLATIDNKTRNGIVNHWLAIQLDVSEKLTTLLYWLIPLTSVMLLITSYVARNNRRLQKEIKIRKKTEQWLLETKKKAENASLAKDSFLANTSHELRTPMNAIIGMSQLLMESKVSNEQKKYVSLIASSSNLLLSLINDVLDLSKIEAGKMELENHFFYFNDLIKRIKNKTGFTQGSKKIQHIIEISDSVPSELVGDELRLAQIVINLINNAQKFTENGEIRLKISVKSSDLTSIELYFIVSDSGIGMDSNHIDRLFDTYNQADTSSTREHEGIGIGLPICKNLSKLFNGQLWATSELGVGSKMHLLVTLRPANSEKSVKKRESFHKIHIDKEENDEGPLKNMAETKGIENKKILTPSQSNSQNQQYRNEQSYKQPLKNKAPPTQSNSKKENSIFADKKVLVVDDNLTNQLVARKMLERVNIQVELAGNGVECLIKLSQSNFDAVLMDIQMPIMDGYTATKKIRENNTTRHLPVIGLSANVLGADVDKAFAAGVNAYLSKPVNMKKLLTSLEECFTRTRS